MIYEPILIMRYVVCFYYNKFAATNKQVQKRKWKTKMSFSDFLSLSLLEVCASYVVVV